MSVKAHYRFYCVSPKGRFVEHEEAHCDSDDDAREHARQRLRDLHHCDAIEVWRRAELVGRVRKCEPGQA